NHEICEVGGRLRAGGCRKRRVLCAAGQYQVVGPVKNRQGSRRRDIRTWRLLRGGLSRRAAPPDRDRLGTQRQLSARDRKEADAGDDPQRAGTGGALLDAHAGAKHPHRGRPHRSAVQLEREAPGARAAGAGALWQERSAPGCCATIVAGDACRDRRHHALARQLLHEQVPQAGVHRIQRQHQGQQLAVDGRAPRLGQSCRTTLNIERWIWIPLSRVRRSRNPRLRKLFIRRSTVERVNPHISASTLREMVGNAWRGNWCSSKPASNSSALASRFSLRLKIWLTMSCSMRAFRASICDRSQSDSGTSWCSCRRISAVAILMMVQPVIASALDLRRRWPARAPSPNSAPARSSPTTAVLPCGDITESRTRPFSMYITPAQRSPCAKMVASGSNLAVVVATARDLSRMPPACGFARARSLVIASPSRWQRAMPMRTSQLLRPSTR